jgi:hypothetical protein
MRMPEAKAGAQKAVDELFNQALLPFKPIVHSVEPIGLQEYIINFNNSQLGSLIVSWYEGLDFQDACRIAVLQVVRISGPFSDANVNPDPTTCR